MSETRSVPLKARIKGIVSVILTVAAITLAGTGISLMGDHDEHRDPSRRPSIDSAATRETGEANRLPPDAARKGLPVKGIHEAAGLALIPLALIHFALNAKTLVAELGFKNKRQDGV
ncbi:hypothetical protein GTO89_00375 [Heliobacterium gestii]|uniref:DUF4405 domain-containing protein n=1 Tax=Heliomicrobium gestii TaxID=2699 RepID=A0A845L4J2_HELGE|nr:DUF4405 domain-containing protein [Heliomicrobium gestii]MBM7865219.1 hypothetical protein [Heliomicrobium gestii]MZP41487.1 hypothetical protein [Heliomicrobium gestii]